MWGAQDLLRHGVIRFGLDILSSRGLQGSERKDSGKHLLGWEDQVDGQVTAAEREGER